MASFAPVIRFSTGMTYVKCTSQSSVFNTTRVIPVHAAGSHLSPITFPNSVRSLHAFRSYFQTDYSGSNQIWYRLSAYLTKDPFIPILATVCQAQSHHRRHYSGTDIPHLALMTVILHHPGTVCSQFVAVSSCLVVPLAPNVHRSRPKFIMPSRHSFLWCPYHLYITLT